MTAKFLQQQIADLAAFAEQQKIRIKAVAAAEGEKYGPGMANAYEVGGLSALTQHMIDTLKALSNIK